jgi:hypothetical protein
VNDPRSNYFVYIIESPAPGDLLDGRTEGNVLLNSLRLAGVRPWYSLATNLATFRIALLNRLGEAMKALQSRPVIHLSVHGNDRGVELTDGTFLTWETLREELRPITNWMQGNLLICMSSCAGSSGCRMAMHEEADHPFYALVGNTGSPDWSSAAVAFVAFYHRLFRGANLHDAVRAMNEASGDGCFLPFFGSEIKRDWTARMEAERASFDEQVRHFLEHVAQNPPSTVQSSPSEPSGEPPFPT